MSKSCVIMRGIPGAGKSTYVRALCAAQDDGRNSVVCSADEFYLDENGEYAFHVNKIGEAHARCFGKFMDAVLHGIRLVILDNTNIHRWEYANYVRLARAQNYAVTIIDLMPRTLEEMREMVGRDVHNVPTNIILNMVYEFEGDFDNNHLMITDRKVAWPPESGADTPPAPPRRTDDVPVG